MLWTVNQNGLACLISAAETKGHQTWSCMYDHSCSIKSLFTLWLSRNRGVSCFGDKSIILLPMVNNDRTWLFNWPTFSRLRYAVQARLIRQLPKIRTRAARICLLHVCSVQKLLAVEAVVLNHWSSRISVRRTPGIIEPFFTVKEVI